jgi:hypothetical protein
VKAAERKKMMVQPKIPFKHDWLDRLACVTCAKCGRCTNVFDFTKMRTHSKELARCLNLPISHLVAGVGKALGEVLEKDRGGCCRLEGKVP